MRVPILSVEQEKYDEEFLNRVPKIILNSIIPKLFICLRYLIFEGNIVVLFPEAKKRDIATKENIDTKLKAIKNIDKYLNGVKCYGVKIMDENEVFGNVKEYKSGKRRFELTTIDTSSGNNNLERQLNSFFYS